MQPSSNKGMCGRAKFILGGLLILAAVVYFNFLFHQGECRVFHDCG